MIWELSGCSGGYDPNSDCVGTTTYKDFPAALEAFLRQQGYID